MWVWLTGSDRGKRWLGWFESVLNGCWENERVWRSQSTKEGSKHTTRVICDVLTEMNLLFIIFIIIRTWFLNSKSTIGRSLAFFFFLCHNGRPGSCTRRCLIPDGHGEVQEHASSKGLEENHTSRSKCSKCDASISWKESGCDVWENIYSTDRIFDV